LSEYREKEDADKNQQKISQNVTYFLLIFGNVVRIPRKRRHTQKSAKNKSARNLFFVVFFLFRDFHGNQTGAFFLRMEGLRPVAVV
jgi:hypothetical protein